MTFPSKPITTTVTFAAAAVVLFIYLLGLRLHAYLPTPAFLISVAVMFVVVTYQCAALKLNKGMVGVILIEIAITNLLFHFIYVLPGYGLWGSDSYVDFASMKAILDSGFVRGVSQYVQLTSYFPLLHILGAQVSVVTHVDPMAVAKWLPSVIDLTLIPLLYLLFKRIFKSGKVALLSILLFVCLQHRILFSSFFIRETLAVILAVACVYFYISSKSSEHPIFYRLLSIMFLGATILAHHLTSLVLVVFLVIHLVVTNVAKTNLLRKWYFGTDMSGETMGLSFTILGAVSIVTFWVTTVILPLQILATFVSDLLAPSSWGTNTYLQNTGAGLVLPGIRYYALIYGSYLCYLLFGLLLLGRSGPKSGSRHLESYSFTLYLIVCGLLGVVSFYLLPRTVIGDRFVTYGWLFGFGAVVAGIYEYKQQWVVAAATILMVIFMFINLFTIHPTEWNPYSKGSGATASLQDFTLAKTVDLGTANILANLNNLSTSYFFQNISGGTDILQLSSSIDLLDYDWIIVNRQGLVEEGLYSDYALKSATDVGAIDQTGSQYFDCVYQSNNLALFHRDWERTGP